MCVRVCGNTNRQAWRRRESAASPERSRVGLARAVAKEEAWATARAAVTAAASAGCPCSCAPRRYPSKGSHTASLLALPTTLPAVNNNNKKVIVATTFLFKS